MVEVRNPIVLKISPLKGVNINPIAAARAGHQSLKNPCIASIFSLFFGSVKKL